MRHLIPRRSEPPRRATRFLRWYCRAELLDEVAGDLYELFQRRVVDKGIWKARTLYWLNVLMFLHPDYIRKRKYHPTNHMAMFRNYFKIGWRNLYHEKFFSLINLFGLILGLTCSIFILLWVQDELSWDRFHTKIDQIYRVYMNRPGDEGIFTQTVVPLALWEELKSVTGVKYVTPTNTGAQVTLAYENRKLEKSFYYAGEDFLRMFDFKLLEGSLDAQLDNPSSIVLTKSTEQALFGEEQALGKTIRMNNQVELTVSGVVEDPPHHSTLQFECLIPFKVIMSLEPWYQEALTNWESSSFFMYIALEDGVNPAEVEGRIKDLLKPHSEGVHQELTLFSLKSSRLYSEFQNGKSVGGAIAYVRIFTMIAILILALACINFANLTTARSEKRAKEVGIRKTVGSRRWELITQFLVETMVITFLSLVMALIMVQALLPLYNNLVNKNLSVDYSDPALWVAALLFTLVTGFAAGIYPAFFLSASRPLAVMKGRAGKQGKLPRKVMVTIQFFFSIGLMISTWVIYSQLHYIKHRDIGYNKDNLLMVPTTGDIQKNYDLIKHTLLDRSLASMVSVSSSPVTSIQSWTSIEWQGQREDQQGYFAIISAGYDYTQTLGAAVLQGRDFNPNFSDSSSMLLNQAAVDYMELADPIGTTIRMGEQEFTVVGILDDVVMTSPYHPAQRTIFVFVPAWTSDVLIRLPKGANVSMMLKGIEEVFKQFNPAFPFSYSFVDEEFNQKFANEELIGKLARLFAILAVAISCLGLFGLSAFAAERRTKEIGIRKVLGASVKNIVGLLSIDFIKLVLIAFLLACPLAWYLMRQWLQSFTYQVEINLDVFLITGLVAILIAQLTVSWQSLKAAFTNPVDSLRNE